ncbi:hypothetical protein Tco_1327007 [Tanacetum coccineum]
MLSLSDSTFSGGGNGEGSAAANSVMHVSADGDCGKQTHQSQMPLYSQLEGTRSSVGTDGQQDPPQGPPYLLPDRSQQCNLVIGLKVRHQQIEANPSLVPLSPYQKLTGISMAQN